MAGDPSSRATVMEGGGSYNRNSAWQSALVGTAIDLLTESARRVSLGESAAPLVIADYGSSQGRNSLAPMSAAIGALRARLGRERPICVVHNDQPSNDFASLFQVLDSDPASYLRDEPLVFPSVVGRSFYGPVLPPSSVTLGWCSNSAHWLSRVPVESHDCWDWKHTADPEVRAAFERQSDEDWRIFLTHRGEELRPGGRLVVSLVASPEEGGVRQDRMKQFLAAERVSLVGDGLIGAEQANRMVMPVTYRARAELMAPFATDGAFAGLTVELLDTSLGPDPIWAEYQRTDDAELYGKRWGAVLRVTLAPSLASALEPRQRPAFLDRFEADFAKLMTVEPAPWSPWYAKLVLAKTEA